ncbi:MAG: histidine kinase [Aurantimonas endophytica]|uniref:sensor histidine kinase n=1 Tax=Aurantimonas endophytica TaxID=1522175 RepID=UPI0030014C2B
MLVAAAVAGLSVSAVISRTTLQSTAASTALFVESFVGPLLQSLRNSDDIGANKARLDELLGSSDFKQRFPHLEIWKHGGAVVYSTSEALIGLRFAPPEGVLRAQMGNIQAGYSDLTAQEHVIRRWKNPLLEIYVPIRDDRSGRVIAVAEIHEITAPLEQSLWRLRVISLLAVAGAAAIVMLTLFGVVHRGSKLIDQQKLSLRNKLERIQEYAKQNDQLRRKVQYASMRVSEMNERYLRQVGAELHDGPAQLLGLAAMSVEHVRRARTKPLRETELARLKSVLVEALDEIRRLSKGLMLPEIENLPLCEVVKRACVIHQQRTGTAVSLDCAPVPCAFSHAVLVCVYRFVQECLNNAYRHAGGIEQSVACRYDQELLTVSVTNGDLDEMGTESILDMGLGLTGLRERVESLGGVFSIRRSKSGAKVEMRVPLIGSLDNG